MIDELATADAVAQAELVRRGEATPRELVEAAGRRIERVDPLLNSVPVRLLEEALERAVSARGAAPFRGVPFLLKDVGARQAGLPYFAANQALKRAGYRAPADDALGARFRRIGLVTIGKSNTPEFGLQSTTQPLAFGPTRNPWDPERSPGGSSGGACAAVAAGLVPVAHASDGAGSIRIPAAWCGVVGLKPSRGRVSRGPGATSRTTVEFVVSRSLRDVAAFLDALQGNQPGDLYTLPASPRPFTSDLERPPKRLRIGLLTQMPDAETDPECVEAAETAARVLESVGHGVEPDWPVALFEQQERTLHGLIFAPVEHRVCLEELEELLERPVREEDVEPFLWKVAEPDAPPVPAETYVEAEEWLEAWAGRVAAWWQEEFDLLLTPTVGEPPPLLSELDGRRLEPYALVERMAPHMAFTEPFNVTGQPAITLPVHWTADGLPVGAQLVAEVGREDLLLQVARQIEEALPWSQRRPPIHA